jgi:hypothetical protein
MSSVYLIYFIWIFLPIAQEKLEEEMEMTTSDVSQALTFGGKLKIT